MFESWHNRWFLHFLGLFASAHLQKSTGRLENTLSFVLLFRRNKHNIRRFFFSFRCIILYLHGTGSPSPLIFSLLEHDILKSSHIVPNEVHMQTDQSHNQNPKDSWYQSCKPSHHHLSHIIFPRLLTPQEGQRQDVDKQVTESGIDHCDEKSVVDGSYTIVDPYAMMIEFMHATILLQFYRSHFLQWREVFRT